MAGFKEHLSPIGNGRKVDHSALTGEKNKGLFSASYEKFKIQPKIEIKIIYHEKTDHSQRAEIKQAA